MIKNANFICISTSEWGGNYAKTIVEIMSVLARENKVLYVDYQFTWKDLLMAILGKSNAPVAKMLGLKRRLNTVFTRDEKPVLLLTPPPVFPVTFLPKGKIYDFFLRMNGRIITRSAKNAIRKNKMTEGLIHINAFNPAIGVVTRGRFNENLMIYHCYDEIEAAVWLKKHGGYHERELMKTADAVITTSEGLFIKKRPLSKRCYLVKNAVNYDLFRQGLSGISEKKGKIIGYVGSIDERLDYDLLDFLFTNLPGYTFEFVGRYDYEKGRKRLEQHPNVHLTGPKPVEQLPGCLKRYAAGIIPFALSDFNKGIYPLKINEYLAAGLPVVMTRFAILDEFKNIAAVVESYEEFKQKIIDMTDNDTEAKQQDRQLFASANSWEARVEEITAVIDALERQKKS